MHLSLRLRIVLQSQHWSFLAAARREMGKEEREWAKFSALPFLLRRPTLKGGKGSGSFFASREKKERRETTRMERRGRERERRPFAPPRAEGERWFSGLMKPSSSSSSSPFRSGAMCLLQVLSFAGRVPYFFLPSVHVYSLVAW